MLRMFAATAVEILSWPKWILPKPPKEVANVREWEILREANEYHGKECVALYASVDFFCRSRQMLLGNSGSITYHFCEWVNWVNLAAEYNLPFVDGHLIVSRGLLVNTNCALDSEFELKTWGCKFFFHFKEPHVSAIMTRTVKVFQKKKKKTFFEAVFQNLGMSLYKHS